LNSTQRISTKNATLQEAGDNNEEEDEEENSDDVKWASLGSSSVAFLVNSFAKVKLIFLGGK